MTISGKLDAGGSQETSLSESVKTTADDRTQPWLDPILLAARHLGRTTSPEKVKNTAAWTTRLELEQAVLEIAFAAGLSGQFADLSVKRLSSSTLPVLVQLKDKNVGLVTAVNDGHANISFMIDGNVIQRVVALDQLQQDVVGRLLILHATKIIRDNRLDQYLRDNKKAWLRGVFSSNKRTMLELGLGSLFGNLLAIGTALFAMQVWDRVVPARSTNTLWVLASGVAFALVMEFFIRTVRVAIADRFGKKADIHLSSMFYSHALDIRSDARPRSPGTLIAQLRDLEQMRELLTSSTLGLLIDLPFVAAFLFIIWLIGGYLVLVPLAVIPFLIIPGLIAQIPLARLSKQGLAESSLRNAILMESIYQAEDIKALQAESRFLSLWNNVNAVNSDVGLKQRRIAAALSNFSSSVQQLAYIGVIVVGVYGIFAEDLSFGAVLACSILTSRTIAPLGQIAGILGRLQNARTGKEGLNKLLELPVDHDEKKEVFHKPNIAGRFQFENVLYQYGPEEKLAFGVKSLSIQPGEKIAILGRVGAGKSTFLRLVGGLAKPTQGRILLDDAPLSTIDVADLRRDIGFVLQESSLFFGTIRDNLLLAKPMASDQELLDVMRLVGADKMLLNQAQGLDLKLREGGKGISGGQKQVLLLARMFLRTPNILILDEPTANLDDASEAAIISQMERWLGNKTLIVATHRYNLLRLVDRIIVIDGGLVVADGPRDDVIRKLAQNDPQQPQPAKQP